MNIYKYKFFCLIHIVLLKHWSYNLNSDHKSTKKSVKYPKMSILFNSLT